MSDVAIRVEDVSKQYRLGQVGTGTLSHDLNRWWHSIRGKEDPYLKIGEANDRSTKGISEYVWALKDINFEVKKGEVLGIIGKNGAGKSTLLKLLSRVTSPTTGVIKTKGRIASLLEVGTGFHPELTGRENIYLNGAILGMTKAEIKSKLDEIIDFSGTSRYIDTPAKRYSSGMRVRLAFAVAAHLEPEILIVDEVLAVGDAEFQTKAIGKMQDVANGGERTVLFVSHNMSAIKTLCSRGILIHNGKVELESSIDKVVSKYLTSNLSKNRKVTWSEANAPKGNGMVLQSVALVDKNESVNSLLTNSSDLLIKVEYLLSESILNCRFVLTILNTDGVEILTTTSFGNNRDAHKSAGLYLTTCVLPGKVLNIGDYILRIRVDVPFEKVVISPIEVMQFTISELDFHQYGRVGPGEPSGFVHINAIWNVNLR